MTNKEMLNSQNSFDSIESYLDYLIKYLKDFVTNNKLNGVSVGLSGGIDSAVIAAIAIKALGVEKVSLTFMPIYSPKIDIESINAFSKDFSIEVKEINLARQFDEMTANFKREKYDSQRYQLACSNIKPRLRMATLYMDAQLKNNIVLGTSNYDEMYTGYFTKFGDAASDLAILNKLLKRDVYEIARILKVPKIIIERPPSAALYETQTDEDEFGFTYNDLDRYLSFESNDMESPLNKKIEQMHKSSNHKRTTPSTKPFKKYRGI